MALRSSSFADHFPDESLPRGVLEGVVQAEDDGQQADLPEAGRAGHDKQPEHQGLEPHGDLQRDHEPPLVHPVGDDAAIRTEEQDRQSLQRHGQAQVGA